MTTEEFERLRCWAEIDTAAITANARTARRLADPAGLLAIVKADAYGHGAERVVPALEGHVRMFGVATLAEAEALSTDRPILLLSPCLPSEWATVLGRGFVPSLSSAAEIDGFAASAPRSRPCPVHLVVDTGMGRDGVLPDDAPDAVRRIRSHRSLALAGLSTHLPSADEDAAFTRRQLEGFADLVESLRPLLPEGVAIHCLNSAGVQRFARSAFDLVRPGLGIYGVTPVPENAAELIPAMSVRCRVTLVRQLPAGHGVSYGRTFRTLRPTRVATLSIGYADGYPRSLSGRDAQVLIGGRRRPVLGRVTMDQIMVDVTGMRDVSQGTVATVLGRDGSQAITANELARRAGTIPWEILTGIQQRVVRIPGGPA